MPKQTVNKKPVAPKRTAKPKAKATTKKDEVAKAKITPVRKKTATKPKVSATKTTTKPRPKKNPVATKKKPVVVTKPQYVEASNDEEYPHDMFPWKLVYKDRTEKRTCYFQCEEHRKKHLTRYKLDKKDILFIGYKYD